jgi:hypothetical protein
VSKETSGALEEKSVINVQRKNLKLKSTETSDTAESFSENYPQNIKKITKEHLCRTLRIQNRTDNMLYQFLLKRKYFGGTKKQKSYVNRDGKRQLHKNVAPKYPMRLTFFNNGTCHFPFCAWVDVFRARAQDIELGNLMYDNDFALSDEGIKLFFELDYRSKDDSPEEQTILQHVKVCQEVVHEFFASNKFLDHSCWVLLSTPKPKYVKEEIQPLISMGCHIVFKNIVVNCEQGTQLCQSVNLRLESRYGIRNLVDCCYKREVASLRPLYCRKLESCHDCLNFEDLRLNCETCLARGKVSSGSIYVPTHLLGADGEPVFPEKDDLKRYIENNLVEVVAETSIVPNCINNFTPGFQLPDGEPMYVPSRMKSSHKDDAEKDFVYRIDRRKISHRKKSKFVEILDANILHWVSILIKAYHPRYDHTNMILDKVSKNANSIFVDLRGVGRCFCRVANPKGHIHSSNRIFFRICKKKKTITQHCYDGDCSGKLKDKETKTRLTQPVQDIIYNALFPSKKDTAQGGKSSHTVSSHFLHSSTAGSKMINFIEKFGT